MIYAMQICPSTSILKTFEPVTNGSGKDSSITQRKRFKPLSNSICWSIQLTYLPSWFLISV